MSLRVIVADMLEKYSAAETAIIVQQTNSVATRTHGGYLSGHIARRLPFADPYRRRQNLKGLNNLAAEPHRPKPGTVSVLKGGAGATAVACFHAQFKMGTQDSTYFKHSKNAHLIDDAYWREAGRDTAERRLANFGACLERLKESLLYDPEFLKYNHVVFPFLIGCGAAKGNWPDYLAALASFGDDVTRARPEVNCVVCRLP